MRPRRLVDDTISRQNYAAGSASMSPSEVRSLLQDGLDPLNGYPPARGPGSNGGQRDAQNDHEPSSAGR